VFHSTFPIVTTDDLARAVTFYRDVVGGTVAYQFPPSGEPEYVGINIGSTHLGLTRAPDGDMASPGFALWMYAEACDAAFERLRAGGAQVIAEPADQPWGERVARVRDPSGVEVIIGSPPA